MESKETCECRTGVEHDRHDGTRCGYLGGPICNKCGWVCPKCGAAPAGSVEGTEIDQRAPERIYLQPPEDVDDYEGRQWCEDDDPAGNGTPWTPYVRADLAALRTRGTPGDFGEAVRLARVRFGLSVNDAASLFGVSNVRVGEVERGVVTTTLTNDTHPPRAPQTEVDR